MAMPTRRIGPSAQTTEPLIEAPRTTTAISSFALQLSWREYRKEIRVGLSVQAGGTPGTGIRCPDRAKQARIWCGATPAPAPAGRERGGAVDDRQRQFRLEREQRAHRVRLDGE